MRQVSLLRVGIGACALSGALWSGPVHAAEPVLEGRWIGGFENRNSVVVIDARFTRTPDFAGTIALPQRGEGGIPLHAVRQRGRTVTFEVPGQQGNLLFEGRFDGDAHLRGNVRQGYGYARFELLRLADVTAAQLSGVYGTYEWAPGKVLLIAPGQEAPIYVDYESGRTGMLFPVGADEFVAGPSVSTGFPVEVRLRARRGADGVATRVEFERRGQVVEARRKEFYREVAVRYANGTVSIAGSLLLPAGPGPHPAIVMIHGSGAVTRDALRPFADHFARNGVAVLITDKRGTGVSSGRWARATFDDLAEDALAGVRYLRTRPEIQPSAIGVHGMSLGGWVAPLAAVKSADVAFVVVESAPVMTPREHERLRVESTMRADGQKGEAIAAAVAFMDQKFEVARTGEGWDRLEAAIVAGTRAGWISYVNAPTSLESLRWNWDHVFSYDPLPILKQLSVPMLVLYGELDSLVPPRVHRARMEQAVQEAGKANVTIREFARANHGFFEAITGGRQEQPTLGGFVAGYFEARTAWVRARSQEAQAAADLQE
ncbi:alpha/beta hydrolase family protein [Luteitalea sp.]|jgi:dienelactone hydrolase|uniref:alpha/beta hydrolase family protein n=1 Tax=Luteitalea sp. TaxID=2004800 RepID=UPI0037C54778